MGSKQVAALRFALIGGVICTICDGIHVYTGTLSYKVPLSCLPVAQASFVLPLFCVSFYALATVYMAAVASMLPLGSFSRSSFTVGTAVDSYTGFMFAYVLTGFASNDPSMLAVILFLSFCVRLLFAHDRAFMSVAAVALAAAGVFTEGTLALTGQMAYSHPQFYGTPYWLAALYMHGTFAVRDGIRWLAQ